MADGPHSCPHCGSQLKKWRVPEGASMKRAVTEMSNKGLGMTCVTGEGDRLVGILTDGDLRRRMLRGREPLEGTVGEAMTRSPQTIAPEAVASEALKIMEGPIRSVIEDSIEDHLS